MPSKIKVTGFEEFVKYPNKLEIESSIKKYFESKNKALTKKQLKGMVEKVSLLQSKLTVSTWIYYTKLELIGGEEKSLTIIKKELKMYDKDGAIANNKNYVLLEDVRGDAQNIPDIQFISKAQKLSSGNLFEIPLSAKEIVYYASGTLKSEEVKSLNTLLMLTKLKASSAFTGFATGGFFGLKDLNYLYLLIALVMIVLSARILMMLGMLEKIGLPKVFKRFSEKEYHSFMMLINDAKDYLDAGDFEKASLVYKEIKLKYEELPKTVRAKSYDSVIGLCEDLDGKYLERLIRMAKEDITKNDKKRASDIYASIQNTYRKLSESSKRIFEKELMEIHKALAGSE